MVDPALKILAAFGTRSSMCMHMLADLSGLAPDVVVRTATKLVRSGLLRRQTIGSDYIYHRTNVEAEVPERFGATRESLPLLYGLSVDEAKARIAMLAFMRKRLIGDWHPMIDKLMADYERGLKAVESLRYGADDERVGIVAETGEA